MESAVHRNREYSNTVERTVEYQTHKCPYLRLIPIGIRCCTKLEAGMNHARSALAVVSDLRRMECLSASHPNRFVYNQISEFTGFSSHRVKSADEPAMLVPAI